MDMHAFIFTRERPRRIFRHLVFWIIISILFFLQSMVPGVQVYQTALSSLICFIPVCILSSYVSIYLLLPILEEKQYWRFALYFLLTAIIGFGINCLTVLVFLSMADSYASSIGNSKGPALALVNSTHALVIAGLALGIKFTKNWYAQYRENAGLAKQKIQTELQLEKARMYPRFLFQSLDKLQSRITSDSEDAPVLMLKISELLSYMLYESKEVWIPLELELEMLRNRLVIGSSEQGEHSNIHLHVKGEPHNIQVVPMSLFSLVEDCIELLERKQNRYSQMKLETNIDSGSLELCVKIEEPPGTNEKRTYKLLETSRQRAEIFRTGNAPVSVRQEKECLLLIFKVPLNRNECEGKDVLNIEEKLVKV
jgi:two-component system, LytTR family, sensor kinase